MKQNPHQVRSRGQLHVIGSNPHLSLHKLSKKYGEIMQLKFGSLPVVVASSPNMAKEFLRTYDHIWASGPATAASKLTCYNSSNMVWAPYGQYWRQARRMFANELLSSRQLESYKYIRVEERKIFMSLLYSLVGKPVVLKEHFLQYTLINISKMALGEKNFKEYNSKVLSVTNLDELREALEEWFFLNGVFNIGDWIPWLDFLDLQGYVKKMKAFGKKIDKFNNYVVNDHRAKKESAGKNFVPQDIVDELLQLADDHDREVKLTNDNVKALMQDVLAGGTDTSAMTLEWAMSELLKQPHLLEKATEELDRVIGRLRWVDENDCTHLPFLDAIVKETFRLHPPATLLAPHLSMEDCNVSGYHIPKGTTLIVNVWSIGRDPRYWDNPDEFCPERFLGKDIDERGQNFELLPFGTGRRQCPGFRFGMKLIRSTLANFIHGFSWKLPDNMKPDDVDMEEEYGLTTHRKTPIVAVMVPRLPAHMYQVIKPE